MGDSALPVFEPKPGVRYKYQYKKIFKDIAKGNLDPIATYRTLILTDLWFVVYFVLGMPNANHQFIVDCCKEIESGPQDLTIDIWAREHLKCVSEDTEVLMSNKKLVRVKDIEVGTRVVSVDTKNRDRARIATVMAKEHSGYREVIDIITMNNKKITVTPNHRLYGTYGWKESSNFRPKDYIGMLRDMEREYREWSKCYVVDWVKIKKISEPYKAQTYDIQISDTETFIANGFVSHNSSIITRAETIQHVLRYPEKTHCIFSYVKPVAKKFLFAIKETLSRNKALVKIFSDVLYENPEKEAPLWSLDEGIIVKRKTNRQEPTVCASGLTEGMLTGLHFEYRKYDDIVTEDIGRSMDVMEDIKLKFDSSQNLGIDGGTHRVIGTFYHYDDPLVYIKTKKLFDDNSKSAYLLRLKPATVDGTISGDPVFLSQGRLNSLKLTKTFRCQQLLDPAPEGSKKFNKAFLKKVSEKDLPRILYRYQVVDPAGKKGTGDPWASLILGVSPDFKDARASDIYILNIGLFQTMHTQTINSIVQMYRTGGRILKFGIEQVGQSTAEVHISSELKKYGINITEENGKLVIFTPAGRSKEQRIEQGVSWHLDNGKLYIVDTIEQKYIDSFYSELDGFPFSKNDHAIDILSYFILDLLPKLKFRVEFCAQDNAAEAPFSAFL